MRKISLLFITMNVSIQCFAGGISNGDGSYFRQCVHFEITKPLRELAKTAPQNISGETTIQESEDLNHSPLKANPNANASFHEEDPVMQNYQGQKTMSGIIANFNGMPGTTKFPLDPSGMAGPNHFVQAINAQYIAYDKTGKALMAALPLSNLWPGSVAQTDPIVLYDKFADRWFISQVNFNSKHSYLSKVLIAISTSPDPTGSYYAYTFIPDSVNNADFPKFTIWSDGYYQTCNCSNQEIAVYDRTKMLAGDPTAGVIVKSYFKDIPLTSIYFPGGGGAFFCNMMLNADGALPPFGSPNYLFYFNDDQWGFGGADEIIIYKISADWTQKKITMVLDDSLHTQPFNSVVGGRIDQPGKPKSLYSNDGFFSYKVPYMRWPDHNSLVCCNIVNVGTGNTSVSGIRWYELRQDLVTNKWSIYQQGTYAPSDGISRWMPSISMDDNGNIGMAYCVSDPATVYPGIRYTGRLATDTPGQMTYAEGTAVAGASTFISSQRWGDYSQTSLDPDGVTFWHTNMYANTGGTLATRIFSFQLDAAAIGINEKKLNHPEITAYQSGDQLEIKAMNLPLNENLLVDLFTMEGQKINSKSLVSSSGSLETTFNEPGLAKGLYLLRVGNTHFQKTIKITVQ